MTRDQKCRGCREIISRVQLPPVVAKVPGTALNSFSQALSGGRCRKPVGGSKIPCLKGQSFFDGGEEVFRGDFAQSVLVGTGGRIGNAVLTLVITRSLDGALGEAMRFAVFILKCHD